MRTIRIFIDRLKNYKFNDFFKLILENVYIDEPISIYMQKIDYKLNVGEGLNSDVTIEKGDINTIDKDSKHLKPLPWEFKCHKFDDVSDFFIAKNNDGVQHISWIYYKNNRNRLLTLGDKEAEIKFCLTMPVLRGKGVYPNVVKTIINYLAHGGYTTVFMCVHPDNQASVRGIEKAGFIYLDSIRLKKILGMQVSKRFNTQEIAEHENN